VSRRPGDLGLLMTLGHTYSAKHREGVDERLRWFQAAVAAAPANAAAHSNLGISLYFKDQSDEAIACFRKAIELDPKSAQARINLGAFLANFKLDFDGAIACFRKAIELDPKLADAHFNLGRVLKGQGKPDESGGEAPIAPVRRPTAAQRTDQKESKKYEFPPHGSTIIPGEDGRQAAMEGRAVESGLG
jgi:tetratricopeptide (TPR) repeat protein